MVFPKLVSCLDKIKLRWKEFSPQVGRSTIAKRLPVVKSIDKIRMFPLTILQTFGGMFKIAGNTFECARFFPYFHGISQMEVVIRVDCY